MALPEKRAVDAIKKKLPEWQKRIDAAAGATFEYEILWDGFVKDGTGDYAVDAFEKVFVEPLEASFKAICVDDIGKEAVATTIKKILFRNVDETSGFGEWVFLKNNVLILDHSAVNIDYVYRRTEDITAFLTKSL